MSKPHEIRLDLGSAHTLVYVNGVLVAETAIGMVETRDNLLAQVRAARTLRNLPRAIRSMVDQFSKAKDKPDHVLTTPAAKTAAHARGLIDGLQGLTLPYPGDPAVPPIKPDHTPSYERGYEIGDAIRRCLEVVERAERGEEVE